MHRATSIADDPDRLRLEYRAARIELVTRELRRRGPSHPASHLIGRAIEGFEAELAAVRARLQQNVTRSI